MKKQENLSRSSREKIEKLYEAVIELLAEGSDINTMKVADITSRAGIGKGTAYEYFENKEEIIANALKYDMERRIRSLHERNDAARTFREKVMISFSWIEENLKHKSSGIQFLRAQGGFLEIPRGIVQNLHDSNEDVCSFRGILDDQMQSASSEGIQKEHIPEEIAKLTLLTGYIEYFIYLFGTRKREEVGREAVREHIYRGMVLRLQT